MCELNFQEQIKNQTRIKPLYLFENNLQVTELWDNESKALSSMLGSVTYNK